MKKLDSESAYNKISLKTKFKFYGDEVTDFYTIKKFLLIILI